MVNYFLDTNIILEWLLNQEKGDICRQLIYDFYESGQKVILARFSIYSVEVILIREKKFKTLEGFLYFLNIFDSLEVYNTNFDEEIKIIQISRKYNFDFDDALQYYVAKNNNFQFISLDKDFDKTDLKRIEPKEVLKKH